MAVKLEESVLSVYNFIQQANGMSVDSYGGLNSQETKDLREKFMGLHLEEHPLPRQYKVVLDKKRGVYYMTKNGKKFTLTRKQEGLGESSD